LGCEYRKLTEDTTLQDRWIENVLGTDGYIDWAAFKPPVFKSVLLRRTALSCYKNDSHDSENTFVSMAEAQAVRAFPEEHGKSLPAGA
jgi:hypothetical protein